MIDGYPVRYPVIIILVCYQGNDIFHHKTVALFQSFCTAINSALYWCILVGQERFISKA